MNVLDTRCPLDAKVVVVIVTWNATSLIDKALLSLDEQMFLPSRVLVVDNGSDDVDDLKLIIAKHERCELLALPENLGFAAANNIAIQNCSDAEFVALLNPDAYPEPEWLAQLVQEAVAHQNVASFASRLLDYSDPNRLDGAGDMLALSGKPRRRGHGALAAAHYLIKDDVFAACAAAALYRRKAVMEVGGFDESFFCYIEDIDLGFRLRLAGYGCCYVASAVVRHIGSAITGRSSDFSVYYGHRNLVFNFVKNMPATLFWILLPVHILFNLLSLFGAICKGRGMVMWRAKRDAILGLPACWQSRRRVQTARRVGCLSILRSLRWSLA